MSSEPIRDPVTDSLLTPKNAMLVVIDYQPTQVNSIRSMDHQALIDNIVTVVSFGAPLIRRDESRDGVWDALPEIVNFRVLGFSILRNRELSLTDLVDAVF